MIDYRLGLLRRSQRVGLKYKHLKYNTKMNKSLCCKDLRINTVTARPTVFHRMSRRIDSHK